MILTIIDGIPLYSTLAEAIQWGRRNNLTGYHLHKHKGRTGYMAGENHGIFTNVQRTNNVDPTPVPLPPQQQQQIQRRVANNQPIPQPITQSNTSTSTGTTTSGGGY